MFAIIPVAVFAVASAITGVQGHGFIQEGKFGGSSYPAWNPDTDPYAQPAVTRIFRKIPNDGPITDITSPDLACNVGGKTGAALVAKAAAGSQVTITMNRWPEDHKGPIMQYMASCNGDCTTFDATQAKWFKIYEDGLTNGVWASDKLIQNGLSISTTIPADLAPGQYLFRHELVALHSANAPQFYPGCAQLEITGGGNLKALDKETVTIPGIYANSDLFTANIWSDGFKSFALPSPHVASLASSGGGNSSSPAPSVTSTPAPAESSPSSSAATVSSSATSVHTSATVETPVPSSTGQCRRRLKRRSGVAARHHAAAAKRHH